MIADTLAILGGAERVLEAIVEMLPDAEVYALVYRPSLFTGSKIAERRIHTSFIDRLPFAHGKYRNYLPLMPIAVEQFDLRAYDLVLSSSYAVAHGVLTRPDQLHISYTHTPMRQAWHHYYQYLSDADFITGPRAWLAKAILHYLRVWDMGAASRVDHFVAASNWVARGIWKAYRREAEVIYPPVDIQRFQPKEPRQDYFITVSRLEHHKKVDLVVEAFSRLGYPLIVVGAGQESRRIARLAKDNVKMLGWQADETISELLGKAKALVMAGEEDFSITAVEAQAAGCPVVAYGGGGACETVIDGETGIFFNDQTVESVVDAVQHFEREVGTFDVQALQQNAMRFSKLRFQDEMKAMIEREWGNTINGNG